MTPRFTVQLTEPYERASGSYRTVNDPDDIGYAGRTLAPLINVSAFHVAALSFL